MEHFYQTVDGFMGPRNTMMFDLVLKDFPKSGNWVELGSWMGRSTAYCAVELINSNKIGKFYCVDTWQGGDTLENHAWVLDSTIKERFLDNILPISQHITPIQSISWVAADQFANDSVDFCYVDALHTYEGVMQDLTAWWPKIKPGAWFGGDDYTKGWPGVQKAVQEFFTKQGVRFDRCGRCWLVKKPETL